MSYNVSLRSLVGSHYGARSIGRSVNLPVGRLVVRSVVWSVESVGRLVDSTLG